MALQYDLAVWPCSITLLWQEVLPLQDVYSLRGAGTLVRCLPKQEQVSSASLPHLATAHHSRTTDSPQGYNLATERREAPMYNPRPSYPVLAPSRLCEAPRLIPHVLHKQ